MRILPIILVLGASCSGAKPKPEGVPNARAEGTFLFLSANDIASADDSALTNAIATSCGGPCDRVYVDVEATTPVSVVHRLRASAVAVAPRPGVYLVPASGKQIEMVIDEAACTVEVGVHAHGAYVVRNGERLPPDPTCPAWDAAICRGEDSVYDWPRLRSELGVMDEVCLAFETPNLDELTAIHEFLRQPRVRFVAPKSATSTVSDESVTAVIKAAGVDMQWCLDGEVAEELVPMRCTLRLAVHSDGSVTRAEVVDGVRTTAQFEACLTDVAAQLVFEPPGPAAVVIEIPLAFEPGARAPRRVQAE